MTPHFPGLVAYLSALDSPFNPVGGAIGERDQVRSGPSGCCCYVVWEAVPLFEVRSSKIVPILDRKGGVRVFYDKNRLTYCSDDAREQIWSI